MSCSFSIEFPQATEAQLAALMQNILDDDKINWEARCPIKPEVDFTTAELADCYRLAWQLLASGVNMGSARRLVVSIAIRCSATPEQAVSFKLIRARFKHMRFACTNCSEQHTYPEILHSVTRLMGDFQDAFRNGQRVKTAWLGIKLLFRLRAGFFGFLRKNIADVHYSSIESFKRYVVAENQCLAEATQGCISLTGRKFHELRKIISRRIALNDTYRVLYPSPKLDAFSLYLATINGLMGEMHDDLVLKRVQGELDYDSQSFKLPDEIASRIRAFVSA
ncbi:hypothetical protein [Azomonas macrocytogenes]|uniref:CHAD domain-containing protein n=1 Tax=Azomonas macrocytogenes TaxID=69962 RepID=A0A839T7C4_AZOMA|nr:hypothetical protein [Azomonas macrocytogenes]MBB3103573.1 hypothetical protein [Azomonas macrocytogenes]